MSSRATATSSLTQMYCCLRRDPQALCSRLNEIARLASVAEKSFTGIDTSPNETVNDAIDRAAIFYLRLGGTPSKSTASGAVRPSTSSGRTAKKPFVVSLSNHERFSTTFQAL